MKLSYKIVMASLVAISLDITTAFAVTPANSNSISRDYKEVLEVYSVAADSDVVYDQYDSLYFLEKDKVKKGKNLATSEFNASNYILEKRVRDYGDTTGVNFKKLWYLQLGVGASQIPPASDDYSMNLLTGAHVGFGKLLNGYNSLRLSFDGGVGYFNNSNELYSRIGGRFDYLFSFSNYVYGYKPTRTFDLSSIVGVGYHYNKYSGGLQMDQSNTFEGHLGLQFKFFAGPQGYMTLEPYVGVGDKNMDMSGTGYWRNYDLFYGLNFSFVYYLSNNLTRNELALLHLNKTFDEFTKEDSIKFEELKNLRHRTPWFVDMGAGAIGTFNNSDVKFLRTVGHTQSFSFGKWISSRFGLRGSFFTKQTTSQRHIFSLSHESFYGKYSWETPYVRDNHSIYQGFTFETMVNLGGFTKDYNWDAPFGATLMFGAGAGTITKYYCDDESFTQTPTNDLNALNSQDIERYRFDTKIDIHKSSFSATQYTGAMHIWAKLSQDLQLYLEPRWTYYMYKKLGSNIEMEKDQDVSLMLGLTMNMRGKGHREPYDYLFEYDKKLYVGLGGGLNFEYNKGDYEWRGNMYNFNGLAFVGYRFNKYHGVRFSLEMASITQNSIELTNIWNLSSRMVTEPLFDENLVLTDAGLRYSNVNMYRQDSYEQWTRDYFVGMPSLSYTLNLLNLYSGYKPNRKTNLDLVIGPSMAFLVGEQHMYYGLLEPYVYGLSRNTKNLPPLPTDLLNFVMYPTVDKSVATKFTKFGFGGHVGLNLTVKLFDKWGMFASPMFYIFGNDFKFTSDEFAHKNRVIMTGNIGATYTF